MTTSVKHITQSIVTTYESLLNEEERINSFLDKINNHKRTLQDFTTGLIHLSELFSQITWKDNLSTADIILIKGAIVISKEADVEFKKFYASQHCFYQSNRLLKEVLYALKEAIDGLIENVLEVEYIIFTLRNDVEFKALSRLVDRL